MIARIFIYLLYRFAFLFSILLIPSPLVITSPVHNHNNVGVNYHSDFLSNKYLSMTTFENGQAARNFTLSLLLHIVTPVFNKFSCDSFSEHFPKSYRSDRDTFAVMEAFARSFLGISGWLELDENLLPVKERELQSHYRTLVLKAIRVILNTNSKDYIPFQGGSQIAVELAFFAQSLFRTQKSIWLQLNKEEQDLIIQKMLLYKQYANINKNNKILFDAMIELFIYQSNPQLGKLAVVDRAITTFMDDWYAGDGIYKDGAILHLDYYNSFVIHPFLLFLLSTLPKFVPEKKAIYEELYSKELIRAQRWVDIQEQLISPEGTYPMIGRSVGYRFGVFHAVSYLIATKSLSDKLSKQQGSLRHGLTTVISRMVNTPGQSLFISDDSRWLVEGIVGEQLEMLDFYLNRGSLYFCTVGLGQVALPPQDEFWEAENGKWSQLKIWTGGKDIHVDHAIQT